MNLKSIPKSPYFRPTLIAVLLHVLFVAAAMAIRFAGTPAELPQEEQVRFNVKAVDISPLLMKRSSSAVNPDRDDDGLKFIKKSRSADAALPKDVPLEQMVQARTQDRDQEDVAPKKVELQDRDDDRSKEMSSILMRTEEKQLREDVEVKQRTTATAQSEIVKLAEGHKTNTQALVHSLSTALKKITQADTGNVDLDPEEGMPGFTPMEGSFGNADMDQGVQESRGDIIKYESLDDFLDIEVRTYEDPKDREKYYMIKIFAKPNAKSLKVMPKEILFAMDCSLSISPERLDEFKRGIGYCLKNLNKDDLFNIVAFRDKALLFEPKSVPATPETIKRAEKFVSELTSNRTTDVHNAFQKIIASPLARKPSNIILISDGRPTHGIQNSRELINTITRLNNKVRPVFAYSGGAKVNRYLLDFLAYQNRAWSQFVKERGQIHKGLGDFYAKIKDPIFLNLRYEMSGLAEEGVFPKSLPDFYRNAEFTLFGKYTDEDEFSMQILGDFENETKELIFSRGLKNAEKGGPEIMKGYAFNKVYHLISRVTQEGQKPELLAQIRALSDRYGVTTPYSSDLEVQNAG